MFTPKLLGCVVLPDAGSTEFREPVGNDAVRVVKVFTDTHTPRVSMFVETREGLRLPTAMFWPKLKRLVSFAIHSQRTERKEDED